MDNKTKLGLTVLAILVLSGQNKANNDTNNSNSGGNGFNPITGYNGSLNESFLGIVPTSSNRGIRNNNPTNIKYNSSNAWMGKIPYSANNDFNFSTGVIEKEFEQFVSYPYGVRAAIYILKNSYIPNGYDTPLKIINRWANNPTSNYAQWVADRIGYGLNSTVAPTYDNLKKIVQSIARWENGRTTNTFPEVVTNEQFNTAFYQVNNF